VQLFRKTKVATIRGQVPAGEESLTIDYTVRRRGARESQNLIHHVACGENGDFCVEVSFLAPYRYEGFTVESGYRLRTSNYEFLFEVPSKGKDSPIEILAVWRRRNAIDFR